MNMRDSRVLTRPCTSLKFFFLCFIIFSVTELLIQLPANAELNLYRHKGVIIFSSLCVSCALQLFDDTQRAVFSIALFAVLYSFTEYVKLFIPMPLFGIEILDSFALGAISACFVLLCLSFSPDKRGFVPRWIAKAVLLCVVLFPTCCLGYFLISGRPISSPILLTLFQTNYAEAIAYIKTQDATKICTAGILCVIICYFYTKLTPKLPIHCSRKKLITCMLLALLCGYKAFHEIRDCNMLNAFILVRDALREYKAFTRGARQRQQHLAHLTGIHVSPKRGGLYVLVIGESETRDHMHAYCYRKSTTPWLDEAIADKHSLLFGQAYSNHVHTVPALTYALTAKNQYNTIKLKDAPSITEVAKAAGYTVYWLSNQLQYSYYDVPVAIITSTVDHRVWLNENINENIKTMFYDEQLVGEFEKLAVSPEKNALVVLHLLGNHFHYEERYPPAFSKFPPPFTDPMRRVAQYDNSIYYIDHVLSRIVNVARKHNNFKCLIYMSDHGEETDLGYGHESSKFTWQMAHIPLFVAYSDSFEKDAPEICATLRDNKNRPWTNDLLYDLLVHVMGIENAPSYQAKFDLSSPFYAMPIAKLKTLHGKKRIEEDPAINQNP
ncbi:MAG: phosphoethanolamine transferase [Pyramidobacter sp.]|nr:phosphoethanolamine transferase [Pyramidobacter sp.]